MGNSIHKVILFLLLSLAAAASVFSQAGEETWTAPTNLSRSGSATAPQLIVDRAGAAHVVWQDAIDGFYYARGNGDNWSSPSPLEAPFGTRQYFPDLAPGDPTPLFTPYLIADANGGVHAFWRDTTFDLANDVLFHSAAPAVNIRTLSAWSERTPLAESVLAVSAAADADGRIHLVYLTSADAAQGPAGLYYRRSDDNGANWTEPVNLYQSSYYRLLPPDEARLNVAVAGENVLIGWDDNFLEQVYTVLSSDGGGRWEEPELVDQRQKEDFPSAVGPGLMKVGAAGGTLHRLWQAGHEDLECSQYQQWSTDGGRTWQERRRIFDDLGCSQENSLFAGQEGLIFLSALPFSRYLSVWNEGQWSEPQPQPALATFVDEETFQQITFNCGQDAAVRGDLLLVVGCGQGAAQDIWAASRSLTPLFDALNVTPIWNTPSPLLLDREEEQVILSPRLLADGENRFHAFWTQANLPDANLPGAFPGSAIYYAGWNGSQWSRPASILTSPTGATEQAAAALGNDGRILATWRGGPGGQIYFSWAGANRAGIASEWVEPIALPMPVSIGSAPDIIVGRDDVIYVAYAVPVNEERGIYLLKSTDRGNSWSDPILAFDAAAAGWDSVDQPRLALTDVADIHLLFLERPSPFDSTAPILHYARSEDGGQLWTDPERVQNGMGQSGAAVWSQLAGIGVRELHRLWQEWDGARLNLWHSYSIDNGLAWSRAENVSSFGESGPAALTLDGAARPYLLQLTGDETAGEYALRQWEWRDNRWQAEEGLDIAAERVSDLAAAAAPNGQLAVLYAADGETSFPTLLLFADRALPAPQSTPTPLPSLTPTPTSTPSPTAVPPIQPTPTLFFPKTADAGLISPLTRAAGGNSMIVGALLALAAAGLIVLVATLFYLRSDGRRR